MVASPRALPTRKLAIALCLLALAAVLGAVAPSARASVGLSNHVALTPSGKAAKVRPHRAKVAQPPAKPAEEPTPETPGLVYASGFEEGLNGWNTAGVGEVVPTVVGGNVRAGSKACRVYLTGSQNRSELILGGNGSGSALNSKEFYEGAEYWYAISVDVLRMTWGHPGAHNLFMQFKSDGEGSPNLALGLWDYNGKKGLWTEGDATGGNRYLAPFSEGTWHDVQVHFRASSRGEGFYQVYLDGQLVDSRQNVSTIVPGHTYAYIKDGLYRNGGTNPGTSELLLDQAKLGTTQAAVTTG